MSTHDFEDKGALMTRGGGDNGVDGLDNSVQCRVSADGHVSAAKVIVNGADHADDVQVAALLALLLGDFAYKKTEKGLHCESINRNYPNIHC